MTKTAAKRALLLAVLLPLGFLAAHADDEPSSVQQARARLKDLERELEGVREARFEGPVAVKAQTQEGCRRAFQLGLEGWLPRERSRPLSRAYGRLGLLPRDYDLRGGLEDLYATQVFAYYQPGEGAFYVVEPGLPRDAVEPILLHELDHALDDQRFGLSTVYALAAGKENDDIALAGQFLIEGEAYYMTVHAQAKARGELARVDELAEAEGSLSRSELEAEYGRRASAAADGKKVYEESAARRAKLPLYVWRRYMEPYTKGALLVSRLKRQGGWKAVDALWRRPPVSTEQVLHPEKLLAAERDEPVDVRLDDLSSVLGAGWQRTASNVLGELGMQCVLEERGVASVAAVTSGWGGDRLEAYEKDEQRTALVWFTTWDTEAAAEGFAERFPARDSTALLRRGKDVAVVEGVAGGAKVASAAFERVRLAR